MSVTSILQVKLGIKTTYTLTLCLRTLEIQILCTDCQSHEVSFPLKAANELKAELASAQYKYLLILLTVKIL